MTVFARETKFNRITVFIQNGWQNSGQWRPEFWIIYAEFWMWRVQNSVKGRALVAEFWTICPEFADDVSRILSDVWQNSGRIYAEFCKKFCRILTRHQNSLYRWCSSSSDLPVCWQMIPKQAEYTRVYCSRYKVLPKTQPSQYIHPIPVNITLPRTSAFANLCLIIV